MGGRETGRDGQMDNVSSDRIVTVVSLVLILCFIYDLEELLLHAIVCYMQQIIRTEFNTYVHAVLVSFYNCSQWCMQF